MEQSLTALAKQLVLKTLARIQNAHLEVVCPRETHTFGVASSSLRGMIVVHNECFFLRALTGGDVAMGESFMDGDWSSPDLPSVIRIAVRNLDVLENDNALFNTLSRMFDRLLHLRNDNSHEGSRKNISRHYDLGNDFYSLFLDRNMAYSSGYYLSASDSLDTAQTNKFDLICRKLQLNSDDHLLEIGTGWGGFAHYAATHYGCRVTTTTISRQQYEYAAEWFRRSGMMPGRIELLLADYRYLTGKFDKIVSIEMFEAVGFKHYDDYFSACDRLLKPNGQMLLQTITMSERKFPQYLKRCDWIQKYIFPGAELASVIGIQKTLACTTGLQLFQAEDIGMHYAETLRTWRERCHAVDSDIAALGFDERFRRMWDYYFAYCEGAFRERHIGVFQLLLTKTRASQFLINEPWGQTMQQMADTV